MFPVCDWTQLPSCDVQCRDVTAHECAFWVALGGPSLKKHAAIGVAEGGSPSNFTRLK